MKITVYVNSLKATGDGILVEASNGLQEGPPFIRWKMTPTDQTRMGGETPYIGKHYDIEIKDPRSINRGR